jgi:hypothetical protein
MGFLKHIVLPVFAVLNVFLTYQCLFNEDGAIGGIIDVWAPGRDLTQTPLTQLELHLVHVFGAATFCFFVNEVAAIFIENSHYRGMTLLIQTLFFVVDGLSYLKMGKDLLATPVVQIVGLGILGLGVHGLEPGIFTKDKDRGGDEVGDNNDDDGGGPKKSK